MKLYKKILLFLVLFLFVYILIRFLQKRPNNSSKEGLENPPPANTSGIQSVNPANANLPLSEYIIKSSYNSALSGKFIYNDMLKYVLGRGCRFLDFEVYYNKDTLVPFVSYSTDSTYLTIETNNSILLDNILTTVITSGFSADSPNYEDPIFIQLRIKSTDPNVYKAVAKSVDNTLTDKLYTERITKETLLSDIMGKVVLVIDKTINIEYKNFTDCSQNDTTCYDLKKYINIESGSEFMRLSRYNEILNKTYSTPNIRDDNISTDVSNIQVVLPDYDSSLIKNPNLSDFVLNYGCQIIPYRFYNTDDNLSSYEEFFKENKYAFVSLARGLPYLRKMKESKYS